MSHTEVFTEDHRRRQFENRINVAVRHCRIGKVKLKVPAYPNKRGNVRSPFDHIWQPDPNVPPLKQTFPGVFSLPPMHEVYGNAACTPNSATTRAA